MSHIFISYSTKNQLYARKLAAYLLEHGFDIWIDDRIEYGDNWWRAIVRAIQDSAACVVVMTPDSEQSPWVQREVALAVQQGKYMFPLLLAGENWPLFVLTQYVDVRDGALPGLDFIERLAGLVPRRESHGGHPDNLADRYRPTPAIIQEQRRLLDIMLDAQRPPPERAEAGQQLSELGDPRPGIGLRSDGLPDIDWVKIPSGEFIYQDGKRLTLPSFWIARYPITYMQFRAFCGTQIEFEQDKWWKGLTEEYRKQAVTVQAFEYGNHPRDMVSWYQAVAFCRWLSVKLDYEVRLPTEQEWEKAARGTDGREYPWGNKYIPGYANIDETDMRGYSFKVGEFNVGKPTAVGTYPQGASQYGVLDMAGNVLEWCLNEYDRPEKTGFAGTAKRVVRGGSWYSSVVDARCYLRNWLGPSYRLDYVGFRVVSPIPNVR